MKKTPTKGLFVPAIRGRIGDWTYYSCVLSLVEIERRVNFADDVHARSTEYSDMIQRNLNHARTAQIADYLATQSERFFNSIVLAIYDSDPEWFPISQLEGRHRPVELEQVAEAGAMGVLVLSKNLKMFAVDGQHRLAGIQRLVADKRNVEGDHLPVVLVGHKRTKEGLQRTRRLFTTLNKHAVKISKAQIIALDEDDAAAIVVRSLVEGHPYFLTPKVLFSATNNIPQTNRTSLTTIGNLYDLLWLVFGGINPPAGPKLNRLTRPTDAVLDDCKARALEFFEALGKSFPPVRKILISQNGQEIPGQLRSSLGGHILLRPVGLKIYATILVELRKSLELNDALAALAKLPVEFSDRPYEGIIWNSGSGTVIPAGESVARDILRLRLDLPVKEVLRKKLRESLAKRLANRLGEAVSGFDLSPWLS